MEEQPARAQDGLVLTGPYARDRLFASNTASGQRSRQQLEMRVWAGRRRRVALLEVKKPGRDLKDRSKQPAKDLPRDEQTYPTDSRVAPHEIEVDVGRFVIEQER